MRSKPVRLTVTGVAYNRNDEDEAMHMTTFGTLSGDARGWKLRYTERRSDSDEKHDITMTMDDGVVTVARKGAYASDLVFRQGHRFEGNYQTPFGDLSMGIYPTQVNYKVSQGRYTSVHKLDIAFETNKKTGKA